MTRVADSIPDTTLDSPLSSASMRYSVHPAPVADGPGPHETRPLGLRFAQVVPMPAAARVRYCHRLQVAVDDDGQPLIDKEEKGSPGEKGPRKKWATKHTTDGDEGPEETTWGWEE
jgi:putative ATP-grasp target RiPP